MSQTKNECGMLRCAAETAEHAFGDQLFQTVGIGEPKLHGRRIDHDCAGEDDGRTRFCRSDNIANDLTIGLPVNARYSTVAQREIHNYIAVSDQVLRFRRIGNSPMSALNTA